MSQPLRDVNAMREGGLPAHGARLARLAGACSVPAPHVVAFTHLTALLLAIAPLLVVDVPALVDYPNHLARMQILSELGNSPDLQAIYTVQWSAIPNLAMDLLVPQMTSFFGVIAAGKIFIALTLILNAAGVIAVQSALYGRTGFWPLVTYLVLYNYVFAYGFLNFLFGVGLFLLLFAFWIASDAWPWPRRLALAAIGSFAIFFSHLGAFATYGLCVAGYEMERWLRSEARSPRELLQAACLVVGQCLAPLGLVLAATPSLLSRFDVYYDLTTKAVALLVPVLFYKHELELIIFAALVVLLVYVIREGEIRFASGLRLPVAGLGLAVLLVPTWALGNFGNGFRLAVPLIFLLIAGTKVTLDRKRTRMFAIFGLLLLAAKMIIITQHWIDYDRLFAEMRSAARNVEPGALILPAVNDWSDVDLVAPSSHHRIFYHVAALVLLERPVFLPSLFTAKGRQPLSVQPPYAARDVSQMHPLPIDRLVQAVDPKSPEVPQTEPYVPFYERFAGWPSDFDYVLLLDFGVSTNPLPRLLTPARRGSFFTLYRVLHEE